MADQPNNRLSTKQRRRNAQVLEDLLQRKEQLLRRQATRHAESPDDIEDALQSAYALFIERFRGDCEPLAWLYTTVKREAWAIRRRRSRQGERNLGGPTQHANSTFDLSEVLASDSPSPVEVAERSQDLAERRQALATLKPDERRAIWLFGLGLSYAEICEATGWTRTKVNRCLSEGRAMLRSICKGP
jgi:RNA polymerase sigma factor (sigma-70 family)